MDLGTPVDLDTPGLNCIYLGTPVHTVYLHSWAHLCAARCLSLDPGRSSGRCYFITDDTPITNSFQTMKPYLESRGYALSSSHLSYPLAYALYLVTDWFLWVIKPIHEVNLEVGNYRVGQKLNVLKQLVTHTV